MLCCAVLCLVLGTSENLFHHTNYLFQHNWLAAIFHGYEPDRERLPAMGNFRISPSLRKETLTSTTAASSTTCYRLKRERGNTHAPHKYTYTHIHAQTHSSS
ncbi:conserved hypothetical protein [Trichinella spiralis]|uniref:hypothetical protein n=1 Tax=Trichinella spiralis TaxID=6334 RepID=UPI0001EFCD9B|nr:conserved hypothetical protein [Trichinella spiralis]